jgi:selenium-dependent xanthine dehydrogenase
MFAVNINGRDCEAAHDKNLLSYLRDDLRLTAAKDGCSEGACGTCTVLVDGKKAKACALKLSALAGKKVLTPEGIATEEMRVYEYCFAEAGAVQCGFCIPGMILSAKSLLDHNLRPNRDEVKKAIRGNLCRCTGYKKIEDAILLAADFFREGREIPEGPKELHMDQRAARIDAAEKVNGSGLFADDIVLPGMLYAKCVYSKYPRALIRKIDVSKAVRHPDCAEILLKSDVPCNKIGHIKQDWDVLLGEGDVTLYVGSALAVVASVKKETLEEVCALVDVDYEELCPVTSPFEALKGDAPLLHPDGNIMSRASLTRGSADEAIARSKYVVTRKYKTSWQEHGFMEPECAVAAPEGGDGLLIYSSCQSVYDVRRECAAMLRLPAEKIHVRSPLVGGGFGGKEDMSVQQYAALMAWYTRRPVKVKYSRQESLNYHVKRHPMEMEFTTACDENGRLTAMKGLIIADTGAYASLGGPVLHRACTHAAGPYNYQNIDILGMSVYTNNVPAGAFRGFGVTQSCFATEMNINLLAGMAGIDPWEFRYRNAIRPGQVLPNGQTADPHTNMAACLEAVKDAYYHNPYAGIACGFKNSGTGMGKRDVGRVLLSVEQGLVHIRSSAACMGQGIGQMALTEICHVTGLRPDQFLHEPADTIRTPDAGTSTASRQTVMTGEAARRAAVQLRAELDAGRSLEELEGREFFGEFSAETDPLGAVKENPVSHISYSYGAQVVILDEGGKVTKAVSAFDVGTPVNIQSVEGQIEGGMLMGLGYALTEEFRCEGGYPKSKFGTIGFLRATEAPELEVTLCRPREEDMLPYSLGAKGCGELCMIPTAPACAHAYLRLDGKFRQSLPLADTYYKKGAHSHGGTPQA